MQCKSHKAGPATWSTSGVVWSVWGVVTSKGVIFRHLALDTLRQNTALAVGWGVGGVGTHIGHCTRSPHTVTPYTHPVRSLHAITPYGHSIRSLCIVTLFAYSYGHSKWPHCSGAVTLCGHSSPHPKGLHFVRPHPTLLELHTEREPEPTSSPPTQPRSFPFPSLGSPPYQSPSSFMALVTLLPLSSTLTAPARPSAPAVQPPSVGPHGPWLPPRPPYPHVPIAAPSLDPRHHTRTTTPPVWSLFELVSGWDKQTNRIKTKASSVVP